MNKMVFLAFLISYISWGYGGLFVFRTVSAKDGVIKFFVSVVIYLLVMCSVFEIYRQVQGFIICSLTIGLVLSSLTLFWWAIKENPNRSLEFALTSTKEKSVISSGPFKYVRHPFYCAYMITWLSYALYAQTTISFVISFSMVLLFIYAAWSEEREFSFNEQYQEYKSQVGMFIPNSVIQKLPFLQMNKINTDKTQAK